MSKNLKLFQVKFDPYNFFGKIKHNFANGLAENCEDAVNKFRASPGNEKRKIVSVKSLYGYKQVREPSVLKNIKEDGPETTQSN